MNEYFEQAEQDYDAKRFRKAVDGYTKAIDIEPSNTDAYNGLARCWLRLRLYGKVVDICRKGLEVDPQHAKLHGNLGYGYLNLGRLLESETELRRAVLLDPKLIPAQFGLACVLGQQRKYQEAEVSLRDVIELEPDNVIALNALRWVYLQQRRMPEALTFAQRVLILAPGLDSLYDYLVTQMQRHRMITLTILYILCTGIFLLPTPASLFVLGFVIVTLVIWPAVRNFRTCQPRKVLGHAVGGLFILGCYFIVHAV